MPDPLITLTTDFGEFAPYVAAMKGVILGVNPTARVVDLSHQVPPQDVRHAAFFLATAIPCFAPDVLHVVVVDPGVGSERALLYVSIGGHRLLVPDNGCWTSLANSIEEPPLVVRLTEARYWREPVSATFHGRDILAPVAGHLSLGVDPLALGTVATQWVKLDARPPVLEQDRLVGEVVFVDSFGNLLTNIPEAAFAGIAGRPVRVMVGGCEVSRRVRVYADAKPGDVVALISSVATLEVAVVQGSAAQRLSAGIGTVVTVTGVQ